MTLEWYNIDILYRTYFFDLSFLAILVVIIGLLLVFIDQDKYSKSLFAHLMRNDGLLIKVSLIENLVLIRLFSIEVSFSFFLPTLHNLFCCLQSLVIFSPFSNSM